MDHASHPDIVKRLRRSRSQPAGTIGMIGMIEGGRSCLDLAKRLHAVERRHQR
jgi:uncharacterized protein